ncbi:hypothetical protein M413DRAFT_442458, partial [Hebeloma cylindrosporum]
MHHIYPCLNEIGRRNIDCDEPPLSLPIELLEEILTTAWLSKMSPDERRTLAISNLLVSKLWMEIFRRVSNQHVFVFSFESLEVWEQSLQGRAPYSRFTVRQDAHPPNTCRSLTRQTSKFRPGNHQRTFYRELLSTLKALPYLPNLRDLTFECFIPGEPCSRGISLPVIHLAVEYTFHPDTYTWIIDSILRPNPSHKNVPWGLPDLQLISTANNDPKTIGAVLEKLTHLEVALDRNLKLEMKILSSSAHIPENCAILHGPVSTFRTMSVSYRGSRLGYGKGFAPRVVRGVGVGLILDVGSGRSRGNVMDPSNTIRCGHVFLQRRR